MATPSAALLIHCLSEAMVASTSPEERVKLLAPIIRKLSSIWECHFGSSVPADFSSVGDAALVGFADAALKFLVSQPFPPSAGAVPPSAQQWESRPWSGWASGRWREGYSASLPDGPGLDAADPTPNSADWQEWRRGAEVPSAGEHAGQAAYASPGPSSSPASSAQWRGGPKSGITYGTQSQEQRRHHRTGQWTDICVKFSREGSCRFGWDCRHAHVWDRHSWSSYSYGDHSGGWDRDRGTLSQGQAHAAAPASSPPAAAVTADVAAPPELPLPGGIALSGPPDPQALPAVRAADAPEPCAEPACSAPGSSGAETEGQGQSRRALPPPAVRLLDPPTSLLLSLRSL